MASLMTGREQVARYVPPAIRKPHQKARVRPRSRAMWMAATTSDARAAVHRALAQRYEGDFRAAKATPKMTVTASSRAMEKRSLMAVAPTGRWADDPILPPDLLRGYEQIKGRSG